MGTETSTSDKLVRQKSGIDGSKVSIGGGLQFHRLRERRALSLLTSRRSSSSSPRAYEHGFLVPFVIDLGDVAQISWNSKTQSILSLTAGCLCLVRHTAVLFAFLDLKRSNKSLKGRLGIPEMQIKSSLELTSII